MTATERTGTAPGREEPADDVNLEMYAENREGGLVGPSDENLAAEFDEDGNLERDA